MKLIRNPGMARWLWLSALVVLLDQATKWLAEAMLTPYLPEPVAPLVNMTLKYNTGAAFSFLAGAGGWQRWFFAAFALGMSAVLLVWLLRLKTGERLMAVSLALVLGGAIGNLIDRVLTGRVVDFIDVSLPFIPLAIFNPWPAFNIADSAISIGVVLLLFVTFKEESADNEHAPR
jgi:signal peptidase II